jgi:uncharacterized membrane protein
MLQKKTASPFTVAVTAVFTAFVCVATMIFSIYVPSTEGFFNIGESMVFLSALLFGPLVGAFAGGVGSMLADLLLGYWYYAPATLVIKACEGYVVGMLNRNNPKHRSKSIWKTSTLLLGIAAGDLLATIGIIRFSGQSEITLGFTFGSISYSFLLPSEFWLVLGVAVASAIAAVGFLAEPEFGWTVLSVIAGGLVMVLGYFVYQMFFIGWLFGIQAVALAEIPVNIGQMTVGAIVALPAAKVIWRAFPHLIRNSK